MAERWRELTGPILRQRLADLRDDGACDPGMPSPSSSRAATSTIWHSPQRNCGANWRVSTELWTFRDSFRSGKQEAKLSLRPEGRLLGLTLNDLARQARQAFYGEEVQRVQRGTEDVRVMVRYPEPERRSLGDLEDMRIRATDGTGDALCGGGGFHAGQRLLRHQASRPSARGHGARRRGTATWSPPEAVLSALGADALPRILSGYRGVSYSLTGEQEARDESFTGLMNLIPIALLMIYALLAIPLRSYTQPLVIMSVIPFASVGAVIGHMVMGWSILTASILGLIALAGVVVNSSLVLVDYANRQRRMGADAYTAAYRSAIVRFRPIVITSITTFAGLLPLMLNTNPATVFVVPMAISLAWGVGLRHRHHVVPGAVLLPDTRGLLPFGRARYASVLIAGSGHSNVSLRRLRTGVLATLGNEI